MKQKSILLVGLGRFGLNIARKLNELGHEVMAIDSNEERVNEVMDYVTNAQIGNRTSEAFLKSLGVKDYDVCIVTIGGDFQSSLETTCLLKELGAKKVVARAEQDVQAKFLLRNGADQIIYPEHDVAERIAVSECNSSIFDYIELSDGFAIFEISPNEKWIGKTIRELGVRAAYNINILAVKKEGKILIMPSPGYTFREDEHLMVLARLKDIEKVTSR